MRSHRAKIIWTGRAPATLHYHHPARFKKGPPPWPDGDTWTLSCDFEIPPAEDSSETLANVHFVVPEAPDQRLKPGTTLWLYEGPSLAAIIEILD